MSSILHNIEGGSATISEALRVAGLDYTAKEGPVFDHNFQPIPGKKLLYRDDHDTPIAIHSESYGTIQYSEAFRVLEDILGKKQAQVHKVASINDGGAVMIQAKMPEAIEVLKGDGIDIYLNAISSHDGTYATSAWFGGERWACTNQISAMYGKRRKSKHYSIRHTRHAVDRLHLAQTIMAGEIKAIESIRDNAQILAKKSVGRDQTKAFIERLFPAKEGAKLDFTKAKREKVEELIESGKGTDIPGVRGTAWGLFNGATEYFDHHQPTRGNGHRGIRSVIDGDKFRSLAFDLAMAV